MSPLAGTVDPTFETVFSPARNGDRLVAAALDVVVGVLVAGGFAVVLLLELPHPAIAIAARGAARTALPMVSLILTGSILSVDGFWTAALVATRPRRARSFAAYSQIGG
jgi:hypothetical protein